jgi:hypothetical protein
MTSPSVSEKNVVPTFLDQHPALAPVLIAAFFAVIGAAFLPYGYYVFLRIVLCMTAVFIGVHAIRSKRFWWLALTVPMLVLWAPAALIHLPRSVWAVLDLIVAGIMIGAGIRIAATTKDKEDGTGPFWAWWKVALLVYGIGIIVAVVFSHGGSDSSRDCVLDYERFGTTCE